MTRAPTKPLDQMQAIGRVLKQARVLADMSQSAAAVGAGVKQQTWSKLENGEQEIGVTQMDRIAAAVGLDRETLLSEADAITGRTGIKVVRSFSPATLATLPVLDTVQAGAWLRVNELGQAEPRRYPAAPDPRFPAEAQWLALVMGDSVNALGIAEGDFVHLVDMRMVGYTPRTGDIIEVVRIRFGGAEREVSLKQLEIKPDGQPVLWPRSTNPNWREPLDPRVDVGSGEEVEWHYRGLVLNAIKRFGGLAPF